MSGRRKSWRQDALSPVAEAVVAGAAIDLRREDWVAPSPGDIIAAFIKGAPLEAIFSQLKSSGASAKTGSTKRHSAPGREAYSQFHVIPPSATPAAQFDIAAGVALAMKAQKKGNIVMAFIDGPTSGAPLHEALNFAGVHCLPLVAVVQIKTSAKAASVKRRTISATVANESDACGFPVIPVDAHDVIAMYRVAQESIHKARHGGGPTLIEAVPAPARRAASNARERKFPDSKGMMEDYLIAKGLYSAGWKQDALDRFTRDVESAVEAARRAPRRRTVQAQ